MKAKQGRLAEAEVDARTALLSQLKEGGKYDVQTVNFLLVLSEILTEQGRYSEAVKLVETSLDILFASYKFQMILHFPRAAWRDWGFSIAWSTMQRMRSLPMKKWMKSSQAGILVGANRMN